MADADKNEKRLTESKSDESFVIDDFEIIELEDRLELCGGRCNIRCCVEN
jgi:hypothetical protein